MFVYSFLNSLRIKMQKCLIFKAQIVHNLLITRNLSNMKEKNQVLFG